MLVQTAEQVNFESPTSIDIDFLLLQGAEWLLHFIRSLIDRYSELAQEAILEIQQSFSTIMLSCGAELAGPLLESELHEAAIIVRNSIEQIARDTYQHEILLQIFVDLESSIQKDSAGANRFLISIDEIAAKLNQMTIFQMMSAMVAGENSRHKGMNPTIHTARVIYEYLVEACHRFDFNDLSEKMRVSFRQELLAVIGHDFGKVLNPKFDGHHKLSWYLANSGVKHVWSIIESVESNSSMLDFLIDQHDVCGHIAAERKLYGEVLEAFEQGSDEDFMRSLFYVQLADMGAIPGMKQEHKMQNFSVWAMLCVDLGYAYLIDEVVDRFPWFTDVLNRRLSLPTRREELEQNDIPDML